MTAGGFAMARLGPDRVRIECDPAALPGILAWLRSRPEVLSVTSRPETSALVVRYAGSVPGGLARSLADRVRAAERRRPEPQPEVEIAHALPGRVRLRLRGVSEDDLPRVAGFLAALPGVLRACASPASRTVLVTYETAQCSARELSAAVRASVPGDWPAAPTPEGGNGWVALAANTAVLAACATAALPAPVLGAAAALTALPTLRRAAHALSERRASVDLLDVAAVGVSLATGQPGTAAFITWLLGVGDVLLAHARDRARGAIAGLTRLAAREAWRVEGDRVLRVPADALQPGDVVVVSAGQQVPADGLVARGLGAVDERSLTGESDVRPRGEGDRVLATSVLAEGQLVVRVERAGAETTAARIVRLLEGAGAKPMTLQRDAERLAEHLVLPTFGLAGASAALTAQLERATSVLITDFGTGIRVAVPAAALSAMALAARRGVLVKGAQYLERLARADMVVFDKTGTLTSGAPAVIDVGAVDGLDPDEVLALCAAVERTQSHPIAEAVRQHAERAGVAVPVPELGSEQYAAGLGVSARVSGVEVLAGSARWMRARGLDPSRGPMAALLERQRMRGASSILLAVDGRLAGAVAYADRLRNESASVVSALRAGGRRKIVLLSGDAAPRVQAVARAVGADEARGELLPEDKAEYVRRAQRQGRTVAMVGDGVNDAPALALADVGISLHGGTDVALETADVVLLEGGLSRLALAFETAEMAMATVRTNLGIVVVPNALAVVAGALGVLSPALAAVVNNGSTVVAALNALRPLLAASPAGLADTRDRARHPRGSRRES